MDLETIVTVRRMSMPKRRRTLTVKQLKYKRSKKLPRNRGIKFTPDGSVDQLSHVGVRYHKGYVFDQLRYTVLTSTLMHHTDKALVEGRLKVLNDGPNAMTVPKLTYKDGNPENIKSENIISNGWSCEILDQHRRVYLLAYKGIEVGLFFKRQLTEIKLNPGDHHPEGVLQDPIEAWQKLDLLGQSAKRANYVLTTKIESLESENKMLSKRVETLEDLNFKLEKTVLQKEGAREALSRALKSKNSKRSKR